MTYIPTTGGIGIPTGFVKSIAHSGTIDDGWLLCDGSAVSRTTYVDLFTKIGTTWGVGDGSTTFNLPDGQGGRVPVGIGASGVTSVGDVGGEQTHQLTVTEMPSHAHSNGRAAGGVAAGAYKSVYLGNTGSAGGNGAHNNMQPYFGIKWVIKT